MKQLQQQAQTFTQDKQKLASEMKTIENLWLSQDKKKVAENKSSKKSGYSFMTWFLVLVILVQGMLLL